MKFSKGIMPLLLLTAGAAPISPARAQFAGFTGNARFDAATKQGAVPYGSLSLYPVAIFATAGRNIQTNNAAGDEVSGAISVGGTLIAGNLGLKLPKSRSALEIGGWYWANGDTGLYQAQGRFFFTPQIGVQLAYLGATRVGGSAYSGFVVYDVTSRQFSRRARPRWTAEAGLGLIRDTSSGQDTTDFSLFMSASLEIAPRVSINASQWFLRDRSADLNRFALGIGFSF